ncbi:MAG: type II secretion system major pseudopilin GspG [Candidatus Sumerlaeota bacterium]|nr:type II secretion system major pseudopilin GspG [Candidatus Sumerlaeota bacterium]
MDKRSAHRFSGNHNWRSGVSRLRSGFTFLEIMLVVVIIGILVALVAPNLTGKTQKAKIAAAQHDIATFGTTLKMFEMQAGRFPSTDEGLKALVEKPGSVDEKDWDGPYLDGNVRQDPWHHDYKYVCPGEKNPKGFDLWSAGPDGNDGTQDDITNWETNQTGGASSGGP